MTKTISNSDDVIDSRDVIARIEELEEERQELFDALQEATDANDAALNGAPDADFELGAKMGECKKALGDWDDLNMGELSTLKQLQEDAEGYSPDWEYGAMLIRESYFTEQMQQECEDCGFISKDLPHFIEIDWEATAENLKVDYTAVDYDGVTYYVR